MFLDLQQIMQQSPSSVEHSLLRNPNTTTHFPRPLHQPSFLFRATAMAQRKKEEEEERNNFWIRWSQHKRSYVWHLVLKFHF